MVRVAPISIGYNPRALWFDPGDLEIEPDAQVVVETARGTEFGRMVGPCLEVEESQVKALKSPLKPVLRVADDDDIAKAAEMEERGREALPVFKEMAAELHDDMHPISVEFLIDGDKAVFYFEAEERIDFRELVRRLASHFHVRIDMRQVGVRDEARMVGGLGHCGQELCCKRLGGEFCPVSIRMAKEQDLSLNPQKISGLCGRLMCCLRYEYDAYKDFKQRAPKMGAKISTPEGEAVVTELDVPREEVALKVGDEKPVKVPLSGFAQPEGDGGEGPVRPKAVTPEAWEEAKLEAEGELIGGALTFLTSQFTGGDKVARGLRARRIDGEDTEKGARKPAGRKRRSRSESGRSGGRSSSAAPKSVAESAEPRKGRRRRSTKIADGEVVGTEKVQQDDKRTTRGKSSGSGSGSGSSSGSGSGRTRRRRSGSRSQGSGQGQQGGKQNRSSQSKGDGPRPGQRSSGLRNAENREGASSKKQRRSGGQGQSGKGANAPKERKGDGHANAPSGSGSSGNGRRKRRSRRSGGSGGSGSSGSASASSSAPKGDA